MTPSQFLGWFYDHDFLNDLPTPRWPRRDTWLSRKISSRPIAREFKAEITEGWTITGITVRKENEN